MNKEAIDRILENNPNLRAHKHTLERMQAKAYCLHRSWGFGQIADYDAGSNRLLIDFKDKSSHAMDPAFCVGKLDILDESHILVRQQLEPDTVAEMIKKQPVEVIIEILSLNPQGKATQLELESILSRLLGETKYKKWWAQVKKALAKDPRIAIPVKKTDPYVLRDEPLTPEQEILEEFYANKNPKKKILLAEKLYSLSGSVEEIANDLPQILEDLTEAIKNAKSSLTEADRLHGVWVRNDLSRHLSTDVEKLEPSSTSIIKASDNLSALAEELPVNYYKRFLDLISRVYPDQWQNYAIQLLRNSAGKFTTECVTFLMERDCTDLISEAFQRWLGEQTFRGPVLYWIVKNRNTRRFHRIVKDILNPRLLSNLFYAIDAEALQLTSNRRIPLAEALVDDSEVIGELLAGAPLEVATDLAQALLHNQGFEPLSQKSVLARFIKLYPEIQKLISGEVGASVDNMLVVSQESFDLRKAEYEELLSKKIPENKIAISIAREHGDLRENAEYKMARQDQDMLLARKELLEKEMSRARVTDFTDAPMDAIGVGSIVVLEAANGQKQEYAILGAWDSNPEKNIISYKTPLGQSLMSKKIGDKVTSVIDGNERIWTVKSIKRWATK